MLAARAIIDARGGRLCVAGEPLTADALMRLSIYGVDEIVVEDARTADVPVELLWPPETEAHCIQALKQVHEESGGEAAPDDSLLDAVVRLGQSMAARVVQGAIGEPDMAGCHAHGDAICRLPVRAAGLAALIAVRSGEGADVAESAAVGAMLMDAGAAAHSHDEAGGHASRGALMLGASRHVPSGAVRAVLEHHEHVDGSGKPRGLTGKEMGVASKAVAVAVAYYSLVTPGPGRHHMARHEAIEFIAAYAGERYDTRAAVTLARAVAAYPAGTMVQLSTGERGVVTDPGIGRIGRPAVRVLYDGLGYEKAAPVEVDLGSPGQADRMVTGTPEH
jgi:hypothetical protein